ncbi:hypothetical protein Vadar_000807 [Vaccinium darrowii]|uniref:Uncharacterized protein n=1 Tax=Vaccinium darrowii TaxID=229202 RepID=A0ACB7YSF3_9ERIC|nr:hypothetical protein Vadar_000807 [Vaccinium darrowii]
MAAPTNSTVGEFQETTGLTFNSLSTPLPQPMMLFEDINFDENSWFADNDVGGFSLSYLAANQQLADNVDGPCYTRESMILPQQRQELLGYSSDASDFSAATDMSVGTDLGGATEDDEVGMVRVISLAHLADQQPDKQPDQQLVDNLDLPFSFSTRESMILPQQDQEPLGYLSDASDFSAATDLSGATDMSVATDLGGATGDDEVGIRVEGTWELGKMEEDAAKHLKVSKSTLKRACREYGTTSIEMHLYSKVIKTETFLKPFFTGKRGRFTGEFLKLIVFIPSNKRTFELQAKNHETVENIKLLIQLKKGILPEQYSLFYRGKLLEDNKTLASLDIQSESASLDIQSESVLFLVFNPRDVMSVSVKMPSGEILKLEVKALHTVHDIRAIIQSMVGVAASNQNLTYEGRQVEDSKTLACYNIKENSLLEMLPLPGLPFQIFVKELAGKTIALDVFKEDRVRDVKKKILDERSLPVWVNNFHLVFGRYLLEEDRDLASYNVEKDATLHVVYGADASSEDHIQH